MSKTVLFQTVHFSISTESSFIWHIDRTLSGATPLRARVLCIAQSSSITGTSTIRLFSVISRTLFGSRFLPLCREAVGVFYSPCQLGNNHHHHVMPPARISLILSRHFSLSFIASGRSSGLHPVSSHSFCMYVRAICGGSIGVHHLWARPCFSSSVLHVWFV